MFVRQLVIPVFLFGGLGFGVEATPTVLPWQDSFVMHLRDKDRTFVTWKEGSWLVTALEEFSDLAFLEGKDITLIAKFLRSDDQRAWFYKLATVDIRGAAELWQTRVDGDNLYLFGRISRGENGSYTLAISSISPAPSDQQRIADRLSTVPADNWDEQLNAAIWIRDQANQQGNREFWLGASDNLVTKVIDEIAATAARTKDVKLALRAISLCTEVLRDVTKAATIGSDPWIRKTPGTEEIDLRMRKLNYELVDGRWVPRSIAIVAEFDVRFNAIPWTDANEFYKLGQWCEANSDLLPSSREKSYRCFQAGFKADPNHNGIRRELGFDLISKGLNNKVLDGDFTDTSTQIIVKTPDEWKRTEAIEGDATWIDPHSETAFITARIIRPDANQADLKFIWDGQFVSVQSRMGFNVLSEDSLQVIDCTTRSVRYSYQEGRFTRFGELAIIYRAAAHVAVRLDASYAESESEVVHKKFTATAQQVVIPVMSPPDKKIPGAPAVPKPPLND